MPMDPEVLSHVRISITTASAMLAFTAAGIYTWACLKTRGRSLKFPLIALTALLWAFAIYVSWRVTCAMDCTIVLTETQTLERIVMMTGMCGAYTVFIVGTFMDSVIPKKR